MPRSCMTRIQVILLLASVVVSADLGVLMEQQVEVDGMQTQEISYLVHPE